MTAATPDPMTSQVFVRTPAKIRMVVKIASSKMHGSQVGLAEDKKSRDSYQDERNSQVTKAIPLGILFFGEEAG